MKINRRTLTALIISICMLFGLNACSKDQPEAPDAGGDAEDVYRQGHASYDTAPDYKDRIQEYFAK